MLVSRHFYSLAASDMYKGQFIERVNILAIGSLSLVCMEETNGNARYATTMVVSGRCPRR